MLKLWLISVQAIWAYKSIWMFIRNGIHTYVSKYMHIKLPHCWTHTHNHSAHSINCIIISRQYFTFEFRQFVKLIRNDISCCCSSFAFARNIWCAVCFVFASHLESLEAKMPMFRHTMWKFRVWHLRRQKKDVKGLYVRLRNGNAILDFIKW